MTARSDLSRSEGKSGGLSESGKTSDTLDIEGVLAGHRPYPRLGQVDCHGCDWSGTDHRAHVAAVLREQIAAAQAEAWKRGYRKGDSDRITSEITPNPYITALVSPSRVPGEES